MLHNRNCCGVSCRLSSHVVRCSNSKDRSGRPTRCTMVPLEDILPRAGRVLRKSAIILRGPPGCGKTWVAKELKKMEPEVRILSIDDYFNVEREVREMDAKGRVVMKKVRQRRRIASLLHLCCSAYYDKDTAS